MSRSCSSPSSVVSVLVMRSEYTTGDPLEPFLMFALSSFACLKVIQMGEAKCWAVADVQSISTLTPL